MATTANPAPGTYAVEDHDGSDPFVSNPQEAQRQRYSAFDSSQFSLYLNGSPAQARRALQAHLAETTRRLQETSHLGNALVQQRKELEEKLQELLKQEADSDIGPELRQRLAELEKEFNDVGRETARSFLPKSRVPSGETDTTAGGSVYSSEAQHSPTKVSVPSRKQRNQQPGRINDIALATEISTSLLSQLKDLQNVLIEKDEALKAADLDRSQLEIEVEGLSHRLRTLDESESRLKDVNWNLETQVRDFEAQSKAATDKEHRLNHNLNLARTEKSTIEREFEELKQLYAKLNDDQVSKAKQHETEMSGLRRNVSMGESERGALQRKVDELATQNQELAKAVAYRMRAEDHGTGEDTSPDDGADEGDAMTPEHSPPPSPNKATPRHGQLESETLKHSLHHAHRMIQQLKNNIHREKTEKIELKRMLQDARDELETNRNSHNGPGSASKRRKNDKDVFKKPVRPDRLGALRTGSQEVVFDEDDWEEQEDLPDTPSRRPKQTEAVPGAFPGGFSSASETSANEGFETANETSDAAFETANERDGTATETDAFQTGAETLDGDSSDDLTETEAGPSKNTIRQKPSSLAMAEHHDAYESTASTSGDEDDNMDIKTPIQVQHPRYRLKVRQGAHRRSTPRGSQEIFAGTPPTGKDSPASFVNSNNSTPAQGQSLFAELGALSGESEDGSVADGTPSRSGILSPESSPEAIRKSALDRSPLQSVHNVKPTMVDSGMMTEEWTAAPASEPETPQRLANSFIWTQPTQPRSPTPPALHTSSLSSWETTPLSPRQPSLQLSSLSTQDTYPKAAPSPSLRLSNISVQDSKPRSPHVASLNLSSISTQSTVPHSPPPPSLDLSTVFSQSMETKPAARVPLHLSTVSAKGTKPVEPSHEKALPSSLDISSIAQHSTEPLDSSVLKASSVIPILSSNNSTQATEVAEAPRSTPVTQEPAESRDGTVLYAAPPSSHMSEQIESSNLASFGVSDLSAQHTRPMEVPPPTPSQLSGLTSQITEPVDAPKATSELSNLSCQSTEPIQPIQPRSQLSALSSQSSHPVEPRKATLPQLSAVTSQATEPMGPPTRAPSKLSAITMQDTVPTEISEAPRPTNRVSDVVVVQDNQPESPTLPGFLPSPSRPSTAHHVAKPLALSSIATQETTPSTPSRPTTAHRTAPTLVSTSTDTRQTVNNRESREDALESDSLGSSPTWNETASKEQARGPTYSTKERAALAATDSDLAQNGRSLTDRHVSPAKTPRTPTADGGTQTMVSAEQIDKLLLARSQRHSGTIATAGIEKRMSPPASPSRRHSSSPNRTPRRPGSSGSMRSHAASPPPLPPDHKEVIAAASLKSPQTSASQPVTPGAMGPPAMPASAYKKRPNTPDIRTNSAVPSPKTGGTTPRPRYASHRGDPRSGASSPITRRSSLSSFTSEIDQRFNIPGGPVFSQSGLDPNATDPRMIQAITQTMIGEFLWKYTRKTGREGMSENRHRRFFWIHPYTRTLYWSEQDPSAAGKAELKAKSVAIDSVREVSDENPYPPGLHQRSLVIVTPGRTIKFTATTGQRHETWLNALQYLLMRTGDGEEKPPKTGEDEIQNEFNGGYRSTSRQTGRSRASVTSYVSRRASSPHHAQIPTLRQSTVTPNRPTSSNGQPHGSVSSRITSMLRPSSVMRGSFSSRRSKVNTPDIATYEEPNSSAMDLSREIHEQAERDADRLRMVNVRACCDGKHDVGHLHQHSIRDRHSSTNVNSRPSIIGSMSSRSHSRAESRGRNDHNSHQTELEAANSGAGY